MGKVIALQHNMVGYDQFPIFRDISGEELEQMRACFRMRQVSYCSGEQICEYGDGSREVGVVMEGAVQLVRIDIGGNRTILEHLESGGIFGEVLSFTMNDSDSVGVICEKDCTVLYMEYAHIMRRCENACRHHSQLVQNMFSLAAEQIQRLSRRVEVLSRRTIREKLLRYFALQCGAAGTGSFTLPFTLSALAEYISTDRSAMMRELRKLREESIVEISGRKVTFRGETPA